MLDRVSLLTEAKMPSSLPSVVEKKPPFLVGFANSIFQSSGVVCGDSNWSKDGTVPPVGLSVNHWDQFEQDIKRMAEMGMNSYRFSIEWSHIEPKRGEFDETILTRYEQMVDLCIQHHMKPMLTLYHFNEPFWFTQLGGFEKENNIADYKRYCEHVFGRLKNKVHLWCTMNEPAVQAFSGYLRGSFPPHRHNLQMTITFLKNMLKAHVTIYHALKALGDEHHQIGIVHNFLRFLPRHSYNEEGNLFFKLFAGVLGLIEGSVTQFLTRIDNDLFMNFFKTGKFDYAIWGLAYEHWEEPKAINALDFFGLNFYGNAVITSFPRFEATSFPNQKMGDMYLPIDEKGFAEALEEVSKLSIPIFITETGFADASDTLRPEFLEKFLAVIIEKCKEGLDIRGLFYWTFTDNYEWNEGFTKKFGLFDADRLKKTSADRLETFVRDVVSSAHSPSQ